MDRFKPLDVQFGIAHDCIRSLIFASHISQVIEKPNGWLSLADMCYADGIISWNMIFGARSQDTHWQRFNTQYSPPPNSGLLPFSQETILQALGVSEEAWAAYHEDLVGFRNTRLAHLSHLDSRNKFPDVQPAYTLMFYYRDWLGFLTKAYEVAGQGIRATTDSATDVAKFFRMQAHEVLAGGS